MFKVLSERVMRRRSGKSPRQWKKLRKAERRGTTDTRAAQVRRAMLWTGERGEDVAVERVVRRHPGGWRGEA